MTTRTKELSVGDKAPAFTLMDERGVSVSLSDFHGQKNVLLVFYPGDMTPGCTMQLCSIRDEWPKFTRTETVVFGVNHGDADSHAAFKNKYKFPFPLLIDKTKSVSAKYGAIKQFFNMKIIKRSVVGIDKNGTVVYLKRGMPKNADILKALHSLK